MRFLLKVFGFLLFLGVFAFLTLQLFFPEPYSFLENSVRQYFFSAPSETKEDDSSGGHIFTVAFAEEPRSFEPTLMDPLTRSRTAQIYESLVKFDRFLRIQPALARSWGRVSDTEWEFQLRDGVKFHHGRFLNAEDVQASFIRAKEFDRSDLKNFFQDVQMTVPVEGRIRLVTEYPDPFLLSKLTFLFILPKEFAQQVSFPPTGTGPYRFVSWKKREEVFFKRFEDYWSEKPFYDRVIFYSIPSREDRFKAFTKGAIDLLASVSSENAQELLRAGYSVETLPGLEVNFLVFNHQSVFKNRRLREAVQLALDLEVFRDFVKGYARSASQFVSSGVFGFNPHLRPASYHLDQARELVRMVSKFESVPLRLGLSSGLEHIGEYLKNQLEEIGFSPTIEYFSPENFSQKVSSTDLFFFGWRSDFGSSVDFFQNAVLSSGFQNFGHYSNPEIDQSIRESLSIFDQKKRLKLLQRMMKVLVEEDLYGVPLLEPQMLYAVSKNIRFYPRTDGQILVQEIAASP